jgi:hypothetical protein
MTPEQEKAWAEAYRRSRGSEPPMPRDDVERRVREMLAAGKDGSFSVVKNLHIRIKNGKVSWRLHITPRSSWWNERPIKRTIGGYTTERSDIKKKEMTYEIAVRRAERLHDFLVGARKAMPDVDERKVFDLCWSRCLQNVDELNSSDRRYVKGIIESLGWWGPAAVGESDDDDDGEDGVARDEGVETTLGEAIHPDGIDEVGNYRARSPIERDFYGDRAATLDEVKARDE